jgi:hypothetical protein
MKLNYTFKESNGFQGIKHGAWGIGQRAQGNASNYKCLKCLKFKKIIEHGIKIKESNRTEN